MISPPNRPASSRATSDLPTAVGPLSSNGDGGLPSGMAVFNLVPAVGISARTPNHEWTRKDAARRSRNLSGVRGLVRAFGRRLVAVECGKASNSPGPLDASLLWRLVAKAAKAVTSHRTPNSSRLCAKFHLASTYAGSANWKRRQWIVQGAIQALDN